MKADNQEFKPFLERERVYLREVRLSDVKERYYQWMNDPEINRSLETRFIPHFS